MHSITDLRSIYQDAQDEAEKPFGTKEHPITTDVVENSHNAGLKAVRDATLEAAARKLEHYACGLAALGGKGATARAAAKMVRELGDIIDANDERAR